MWKQTDGEDLVEGGRRGLSPGLQSLLTPGKEPEMDLRGGAAVGTRLAIIPIGAVRVLSTSYC